MGRVISTAIQFIDGFTKPSKEVINSMRSMGNEAIKAGKQIQSAGKTITSVGSTLTKAITVPIAGVATAAVKTAADFEAAMSEVGAISGASAQDLATLTAKAKEMGATTSFSASESAEAMKYMAMAGWGKSTLAAKYHNYFGMKCGSAWKGKSVNMSTCEEYEVGVLTQIKDNFRVYDSLEEGVKGYFDFISASRYANLKGVTDPKTYIENIKADGYATSSQYVKNLLNLVSAYNLTQYDNITAQQGKKSVAEIAQEVIAGAWGNGTERKEKLEAAGYNYAEVQAIVNERAGNKTENKVDNKKSIAEIAQEVVAGKWGNGSERKQRLEAEGYDYAEVQATVNNIMGKSQPNKKNVAEIANEVISGKWGNGSERKEKLEAAGYNYAEVQAKVNEMLR